jgi:hypothetical protein
VRLKEYCPTTESGGKIDNYKGCTAVQRQANGKVNFTVTYISDILRETKQCLHFRFGDVAHLVPVRATIPSEKTKTEKGHGGTDR